METCTVDDILYELFVFAEWRPDPDFVRGEVTSNSHWTKRINHFWKRFTPEQTLVEYISNFIDQLQSWQICLGENGKVVAVLQDTTLEIRTRRGNFSNTVARVGLPKDPNPQWRKMAWSPDCSMLAVAHGNGRVSFYDLLASNLFNIQPDCSQPIELQCTDTTHAIASISYLTNRVVDQKWSYELLLVDYKGSLRSFFISPTDGCKLYHEFHFDGGISSVTYHARHNMIFTTGLPSTVKQEGNKSSDFGLQGWRLLNDPPFYKKSVDYNTPQSTTYTSLFMYYLPFLKNGTQSVITKSIISPNGSLLACIHKNGTLSIWQIPILKLLYIWDINMQSEFNTPNPLVSPSKNRGWPVLKNGMTENTPVDINWWNDEAVILSRLNGSINICSITNMHNMLQNKPVFFQGHPQITATYENGFLSLECESILIPAKKLRRNSENELISNTEDITDDGTMAVESISMLSRMTELLKTILYIVTDMERFQPTPKQLNLLNRIFRLLCLRSTTPEDLYLRKIENAEYEEALSLADTYKLDSDCVYQQQWRCSKVSSQSIKDYLGKVIKKIWTIQQCCDRIPDSVEAAKELLEFGLKLTNKEIFNGLNATVDKKTFYEKKMWDDITLEELSVQSMEILRYRYTMLFYFDRLEIYKSILRNEDSLYNSEEYNRIRTNTICQSSIEYAKEGRIGALICLWPHLQNLSLQLVALQNIPETLNPNSYKTILPSHESDANSSFQKILKRTPDWCEKEIFRSIWNSVELDEISIDENLDGVTLFPPTSDLTEWYSSRAHQIEKLSGLTQHALTLVKLALEKNVQGLENLHHNLITLDVLQYDINVEPFSLSQLEESSQSQIANLLMSKTTKFTIVDDVKTLLLPYLERCEKLSSVPQLKESLFTDYVLGLCSKDLNLTLLVFQNLPQFGFSVQKCLELAEKCFMAQESYEISLYFDILEALPESCDDSLSPSQLFRVVDEMERILNACSLMKNHGVDITYPEMKAIVDNPKEAEDLLTRMARISSKLCNNASSWNNLLMDILNLKSLTFNCVDNNICLEIFASSLLSSGNKQSILSAHQILTTHSNNGSNQQGENATNKNKPPYKINVSQKIPFDKSVSLVLTCAREYYNSSSDLNDPALELAWTCLQLIKDDVEEVKTEKNLLSALKILNDFELSVLPVQVRLYPSKIEFIEECLNCNEKAFKYVDKVLQLAKLLGVAGEEEEKREVIIVSLCAIKSIEAKDYNEAKKLGKHLVAISDGPSAAHGVDAAHKLGANANLTDLPLRHQLLNIALLYCQPNYIEDLLQIRSTVEIEILQSEINNLVNMTNSGSNRQVNLQDSMESTEEDYVDALTSPIVENKMITAAQVVEKYIQKPFNVLTDKNNWKNAMNFSWTKDQTKHQTVTYNSGKLACHCFYSSLHPDCYISTINIQYDRFSTPDIHDPQLVLLFSLIRNYMLLDSVKYGNPEVFHLEPLVQCAKHMLAEDTSYCISQLLSVHNLPDFNKHIQTIELDMSNVHTILYMYALINFITTNPLPDEGFHQSPTNLVANTFKIIRGTKQDQLNESLKGVLHCKQTMVQLMEGKKLIKMGCNVDIELFTRDPVYRKSMILDLSKTHSSESLELASKLAEKYKIDEQDVIISNLLFTILNHETQSFSDCLKKVTDPTLTSKLQDDTTNILDRLTTEIWNILDGKDLNSLILYFNVIENINNRYLTDNLSPKEHLKLIKKLKSACPGFDYKMLLSNPSQNELFIASMPLLTKDNIGFITKLLRNLPPSLNLEFNSSCFYREWLTNYFFNVPESMQSNKKWMQQHRECSSYFSKLNAEDLLTFSAEILFSDKALDKLPSSTRIQIAQQTTNYCQHEHNNLESSNINYRQSEEMNSWQNVAGNIHDWANFLENFHSDNMKEIIENSIDLSPKIWRQIEQSQGVEYVLKTIFIDLAMDFCLTVKNLLSILNLLHVNFKIEDIILEVVSKNELNLSSLSRLMEILMELKLRNGSVHNDILDKMKIYTTSSILSSKQRLDLMSLYKIPANDENNEMLEKISIEMINTVWGQEISLDFNDIKLEDPYNRKDVFIQLINANPNWEKLKTLVDLMNMWPLQLQEQKEEVPVLLLIKELLKNESQLEDNIPLLKLLLGKQVISEDDIKWIVLEKSMENIFGKIWLCILAGNQKIYKDILPKIALEIKDTEILTDQQWEDLMSEILKRKIFVLLVKTKLYPKLVQFLFKKSCDAEDVFDFTLEMAVADLLKNGHYAEAGAIKMSSMGIPDTLRGFSQSLLLKFDQTT